MTTTRTRTAEKRRSDVTVDARVADLEREVERLKANVKLTEAHLKRLESMLLLVKR